MTPIAVSAATTIERRQWRCPAAPDGPGLVRQPWPAPDLCHSAREDHLVPERIGSAIRCPPEQRDRNYPAAISALTAAGVTFVDGRAALEAARSRGLDLFPSNGTHWNALGAALFVDAVTDAMRRDGMPEVPRLRYEVSMDPVEHGGDNDLIDLANLLWPPAGPPAPTVRLLPPDVPGTLRMASVNDSFMYVPRGFSLRGKSSASWIFTITSAASTAGILRWPTVRSIPPAPRTWRRSSAPM